MTNDEIKEIFENDHIIAAFQNLAGLFSLIGQSAQFLAEQFNNFYNATSCDLSPDDSSDVTSHIKHLALHSKKFRVRKKNYKRLWKRQKIP